MYLFYLLENAVNRSVEQFDLLVVDGDADENHGLDSIVLVVGDVHRDQAVISVARDWHNCSRLYLKLLVHLFVVLVGPWNHLQVFVVFGIVGTRLQVNEQWFAQLSKIRLFLVLSLQMGLESIQFGVGHKPR